METNKVKVKQAVDAGSAAEYLEAFCDGLRKGRVVVERGDEFVVLPVADLVELEVKAKKKRDKAKFSMELSWRIASEAAASSIPGKDEPAVPATVSGRPNVPAKAEASGHVCSVCGVTPVESRSAVCALCEHEATAAPKTAVKKQAVKKQAAKKAAPKKAAPKKTAPRKSGAKK